MWLNYHHIGTEIFYDFLSNKYVVCDNSGEDPKCKNKVITPEKWSNHATYLKRFYSCEG